MVLSIMKKPVISMIWNVTCIYAISAWLYCAIPIEIFNKILTAFVRIFWTMYLTQHHCNRKPSKNKPLISFATLNSFSPGRSLWLYWDWAQAFSWRRRWHGVSRDGWGVIVTARESLPPPYGGASPHGEAFGLIWVWGLSLLPLGEGVLTADPPAV